MSKIFNEFKKKGAYERVTLYGCRDKGDGYTSGNIISYFLSNDDAVEYGGGKDGYGGNCDIEQFQALELESTSAVPVYLLDGPGHSDYKLITLHPTPSQMMANIYQKLSAEERELLGMPRNSDDALRGLPTKKKP